MNTLQGFRRALTLAIAALVAAPAISLAQEWPTRPVKIVVPFAPGGGSDFIARYVAKRLTDELKQPFIVENRPGAGGNIGTEQGIKAPPDGYTLTLIASSYTVNPSVYKLNFDPVADITPIIQISQGPLLVVVTPSLPVKTLQELIALSKAKPNEVNFASSGQGSIIHAATEMFNLRAGTKMTHVPYKGSGPALTDTLAGTTQVFFSSASTIMPQVQAGKLRAIAVTTPKRIAALPNVPTVAESGVPGFEVTLWHGLIGPKGMPTAIVDKINADMNEALRSPGVAQRLAQLSAEPVGGTRAATAAYFAEEIERWRNVIKAAGVKIE